MGVLSFCVGHDCDAPVDIVGEASKVAPIVVACGSSGVCVLGACLASYQEDGEARLNILMDRSALSSNSDTRPLNLNLKS